ncbi:MAG TPA: MarR family transcriptional regulator [Pinirhizobacter sp.]|uniref:MarR family winged helix-turn-helix transcriptional regulator n=1 Tax=Pinirhizobacter sp. TaxID=2950432 RepID=UPI002C1E12BB|nr:MarR family transcriptional regulator [Pinirhizobacter sp.]HMH68621.1 MarR family transcriptional regulator [Pinirhizobacter sp.]
MNSSFAPTERRLAVTCERHPAFPREPAVLVRLIKHIYKVVHDDANAVLKPFGLNHPEYNLLMMMYGTPSGEMTPSDLADAAGEKSANITRLTNQLCEKGLIHRKGSSDDRRKVVLTLTPGGEALIESFLPEICGLLGRQTDKLGADDQHKLERLLKKMLDGLID